MVSSPHRERPRYPQDHDRGLGAQASDCPCGGSFGRALYRTASFCVLHNEWRMLKLPRQFRSCPFAYDGAPMMVRGGTIPTWPLAFMPIGRMGPPLRSFAAGNAHDCIMVQVLRPTGYKVVARFEPRPKAGSPSDRHSNRTKHLNLLTKKVPYKRLEQASSDGSHAMVRLLARVIGVGTETADMLVQEALSRNMRDRRQLALCRPHWLTRRRNAGRRAGPFGQCSGSTRHDSIGVAVAHVNSALAQWFRARTENARGTRKTMIVALARKSTSSWSTTT